jgi:hypothetical protein
MKRGRGRGEEVKERNGKEWDERDGGRTVERGHGRRRDGTGELGKAAPIG